MYPRLGTFVLIRPAHTFYERINITINEKQEKFEFSQQEFFEKLTATCGKESLIPMERLRQRIETLSELD